MNRKSMFLIIVCVCLTIVPIFGYSQTTTISNGLNWLNNSQTQDGSWDSLTATTTGYYATAAVLDSFALLNVSSQQYTSGLAWLQNQSFDTMSTTYLAPEISVLANTGMPISSNVIYKNSDSGWGGYIKYPSNNFHTALALQALHAVNYSDTALIGQSLNYLTANQNIDGGWGLSANDASNSYITSTVLRTLAEYNSVFINQNSINKAAVFLLAMQTQNNDGGFGSSPSTVYDTALSLMSLIESGQGSAQAIQSGINYHHLRHSGHGPLGQHGLSVAHAGQ